MDDQSKFIEDLDDLDVNNVYIYASDAVRFDFLRDNIDEMGVTVKTVAASTNSPPSFTSLLTGLHPPSHGVSSFSHHLDDSIPMMIDLYELNTDFLNSIFFFAEREHDGIDPIYRMLGIENYPTQLKFNRTPFLFFERGPGGHAPYGDFSGGATEYFKVNDDLTNDKLTKDYERSLELDSELFESRIEQLRSRGLLEDTLIIYTSDHGELLGEAGMVGHNSPMRPETIYVPTVFAHPDLSDISISSPVMHHVDLFPTILGVLKNDFATSFDGYSLIDDWPEEPRCSIYNNKFVTRELPVTDGQLRYEGVWDADGGYVFPSSSILNRILVLAGKLYKSPKRDYLRSNATKLFKSYCKGTEVYGQPAFSKCVARNRLDSLGPVTGNGNRNELTEHNREQLEDLGYL
jgi:hypothetical protein